MTTLNCLQAATVREIMSDCEYGECRVPYIDFGHKRVLFRKTGVIEVFLMTNNKRDCVVYYSNKKKFLEAYPE